MAASKITWENKEGLTDYEIRINQVQDRDMNEIKTVVNINADETDANKLLIDSISSGYQGELLIADTPTADGYYLAGESGTYTNAGGLVVDLTVGITFINVSDTQTTFSTTIIPVTVPLGGEIEEGNIEAVEGGKIFDYVVKDSLISSLSDAYIHSKRADVLNVNAKEIEIQDVFINDNKDSYFALNPLSVGVDKICVQIPDADANDGEIVRGTVSTRVNKFNTIVDSPINEARLDYTNLKPQLLLEESSENLHLNTVFDGAVSGTGGTGIQPTFYSGVNSGDLTVIQSRYENGKAIIFKSTTQRTFISRGVNIVAGTYIGSAEVTVLEGSLPVRDAFMMFDTSAVFTETYYANGVEIGSTDILVQGHYKMTCVIVSTGAGICDIRTGAGNIATVTATVKIDTPQFEVGNEATSYIPTTSNGITKTRNRDDASNFALPFSNKEGIINLKVSNISSDGISDINFSDGTNNNRVRFRFNYSVSVLLRVEIYKNNVLTGVLTDENIDLLADNLVSLQLQDGNYKLAINGVVVDSDVISGVPELNRLDFHAASSAGSSPFQGFVEYVSVTPIKDSFSYSDLIEFMNYGDSITEQGYWQPYVIPVFPNCNFVNEGVGGSTIANIAADSFSNSTRISTLSTTAKYISVMGFTNDFAQNIPLGTITDTGDITAYGGLMKTIERLMVQCPNAEIVLMTPIYKTNENTVNTEGLVLEDYRNVVREVSNKYQLKIFEVAKCGISRFNDTVLLPDGTHPREIGGELISKVFISGLKDFIITE